MDIQTATIELARATNLWFFFGMCIIAVIVIYHYQRKDTEK